MGDLPGSLGGLMLLASFWRTLEYLLFRPLFFPLTIDLWSIAFFTNWHNAFMFFAFLPVTRMVE
jgi:hypothetical protein